VHGGDSDSPSLFFAGMAGARVPIVVAHGEGHVNSSRAGLSHVAPALH
jgi:phosphoribosylformylglycinamidine synthase